jgi:hypothetical protein
MADLPNYQDLRTFYQGTVAMFKRIPVYVVGVGTGREMRIRNLLNNRESVELYDPKTFASSVNRLGMVNVKGTAYYLQRTPQRRYQMGINKSNTVSRTLPGVDYRGHDVGRDEMGRCDCVEVAKTLIGKYTTFPEALEIVKTFGGAVAFDRQFAIDQHRAVFYKSKIVGQLPRMCTGPEMIVFDQGFEYLKSVIGEPSYEKIASSIGA